MNAFIERFIHSIKEGCLDRVIPLGESHLRELIHEYIDLIATNEDSDDVSVLLGNGAGAFPPQQRFCVVAGTPPCPDWKEPSALAVGELTGDARLRGRRDDPPLAGGDRCPSYDIYRGALSGLVDGDDDGLPRTPGVPCP